MTFCVWTSVSASNSSSRVPNPPGKNDETVAVLHEAGLASEEVPEFIPISTHWLMPSSNGSSIPRPMLVPPASKGALVGPP